MLNYSFMFIYLNKIRSIIAFCFLLFPILGNAEEKISHTSQHLSEPFQDINTKKLTQSIYVRLYHAEAEQVAKILEKKSGNESLLSKEGKVAVDKATNAVWVSDFPSQLIIIQDLLKKIDKPVQQVILQAYIVNADQNFTRDIGLDFSGDVNTSDDTTLNPQDISSPHIFIKKNKLGIIAKLSPHLTLETALTALENQGRGRILSHPRLVTSNGKPAYIGSGDEIPYQERTSHGNTNVAFKKAVLSLEVTPQLLPNNTLILDLIVHQDKVSALLVNGVPAIHTQEVRTQVRVNNKQTVVLGGIFEYVQSQQLAKIPVLGNLPILGKLFQHKINKLERRELLIFITPIIVRTY